eukprot:scaffold2991_cov403-Prasinococcus_capsulatus_cf.AAC.7
MAPRGGAALGVASPAPAQTRANALLEPPPGPRVRAGRARTAWRRGRRASAGWHPPTSSSGPVTSPDRADTRHTAEAGLLPVGTPSPARYWRMSEAYRSFRYPRQRAPIGRCRRP